MNTKKSQIHTIFLSQYYTIPIIHSSDPILLSSNPTISDNSLSAAAVRVAAWSQKSDRGGEI